MASDPGSCGSSDDCVSCFNGSPSFSTGKVSSQELQPQHPFSEMLEGCLGLKSLNVVLNQLLILIIILIIQAHVVTVWYCAGEPLFGEAMEPFEGRALLEAIRH